MPLLTSWPATVSHLRGFKLWRFSPGRAHLAATRDDDDVTIIDVNTGKVLQVLTGHAGGSHWPAYSPDGRHLAVACGDVGAETDGCVKLWDVAAGRLLPHPGRT